MPMLSVPITNDVVSSNPVHDEVRKIQHYVIKFVSDLWQVDGFFPGTPVSSTNKTDRHDITEILLKVALNNITPALALNVIFNYPYVIIEYNLI